MTSEMTSTEKRWKKRESGIELLRLISMFMIVISHVLMSLCYVSAYVSDTSYVLPIYNTSFDIRILTLVFIRHFGNLGTTVFFICSAWFLIDKEKVDKKKWLRLLLDNWVISVLIFLSVLIVNQGEIVMNPVYCFLPFLYGNNWFISCYLILLVIAPFLNMIIRAISKKTLFRLSIFMSATMVLMGYVLLRDFFASPLVVWFVVYFVIAYIKLYKQEFASRTITGIGLFLAGLIGLLGTILASEALAKAADAPRIAVLDYNIDCNPFIIVMAFGLFTLFRKCHFKNQVINYLASLTLFVYLIHENIILRKCYRPLIWKEIYSRWGYRYIISKLLLVSLCVFLASVILSILYDKTIRKVVTKAGDWLYKQGKEIYLKFEDRTV